MDLSAIWGWLRPTLEIIMAVVNEFGVKEKSITESAGKNNKARKIAMYLMYQYSGIGNNEIGELFGGIHYSAVSKVVARLKQEMRYDKDMAYRVEKIKSYVKT